MPRVLYYAILLDAVDFYTNFHGHSDFAVRIVYVLRSSLANYHNYTQDLSSSLRSSFSLARMRAHVRASIREDTERARNVCRASCIYNKACTVYVIRTRASSYIVHVRAHARGNGR